MFLFLKNNFFALLTVTAIMAACASKPVNMPSIPSTANATTEIENTERMLHEARQNQVDVLSPKNFTAAERSFEKAKKMKDKDKPNEKILEELAYAQGFLMDAQAKSEISTTSMKAITAARSDALKANAPTLLPKEWRQAEKELESITKKIEKGDLTKADKEGAEITALYKELEIKAVQRAHLGVAAENIEIARRVGAEKKAPKTWNMAMMKFENASKVIVTNPKNTEIIRSAASDATRESVHLTDVISKVNAGNSEDLVLMTERQQRQIGSLRSVASTTEKELATTEQELAAKSASEEKQRQTLAQREQELQKSQELLKTAETLRRQFKPTEADVFVDEGKVMVRLKALQFPPSQATLGPKNQAFLKKVDSALQNIEVGRVRVEGHTDATGNPDKNAILSEKRAQSVEQYLTAKGTLSADQVEAVGVGSEKPISDNSTVRGRAQNRRIDLVIETE